ncbi:MAG: hypothetical protein ACPGUE_09845 [Marinomonas sp.]
MATQAAVWDFMFKHELKTSAELKRHIEKEFSSNDLIIQSVGSNFWRQKLNGQIVRNKSAFNVFATVLKNSANILNHPFWTLIAARKLDAIVIHSLMKRLSYTISRIIRSSTRKTKSYPLKQSYASQKQRLFEINSLDSLTALLLISITEIKRYKKGRSNQAEQLAFKQFFQLFTCQYPIKDRDELAIEVDKLLCHVANEFHVPFVECEKDESVELAKSINPIFFGTLYTKNIANGMFKIVEGTT